MIVAAHLFGLYSVRSFDQQQLAWNSGTEARSQIAADHDAQLESTKKAMTEHASTLWTARAEADKATEETSRLLAELAQIQTQLAEQKRSQQSATDSETTAVAASKAAIDAKKAAEERVEMLGTRETELKIEVARLEAQQNQLAASVSDEKAAAAKVAVELGTVRKQLEDAEKQLGLVRSSLTVRQAELNKANEDMEGAITKRGAALQSRETLVTEATVAEQKVAQFKAEEAVLVAQLKALQDTEKQIVIDKAEVEALKKERSQLQAEEATLKTRVQASEQQADVLQAKLKELEASTAKITDAFASTVGEHGKVLRQKESLLNDITGAEKQLADATAAEQAARTSAETLGKSNQQLILEKARLTADSSTAKNQLDDLLKQIEQKTAELAKLNGGTDPP